MFRTHGPIPLRGSGGGWQLPACPRGQVPAARSPCSMLRWALGHGRSRREGPARFPCCCSVGNRRELADPRGRP